MLRNYFVSTVGPLHQRSIASHVLNHCLEITKGAFYPVSNPAQVIQGTSRPYADDITNLLVKSLSHFAITLASCTGSRSINDSKLICVNLLHRMAQQFYNIQGIFFQHKLSQASFCPGLREANESFQLSGCNRDCILAASSIFGVSREKKRRIHGEEYC
jgi:hypothetical protein